MAATVHLFGCLFLELVVVFLWEWCRIWDGYCVFLGAIGFNCSSLIWEWIACFSGGEFGNGCFSDGALCWRIVCFADMKWLFGNACRNSDRLARVRCNSRIPSWKISICYLLSLELDSY